MDKVELPSLHSMSTGSVEASFDTLPDLTSTTPPPSSESPTLPPLTQDAEEEEETSCPPPSSEQEVVDVESHQPCVVDLTHEDEDDIDVVAEIPQEQSIIYLGTEQRRSRLRRRNANNVVQSSALEDLPHPDRHQNTVFESGGDSGSREEENNVLTLGSERQQNSWLLEAPPIDFQNTNLLFGNLLEDYPMGSGDSHIPRRPNPLREFRPSSVRQSSRSRSPQLPEYGREGTRTPEIVQDVHEMQSEVEGRRPFLQNNVTQIPMLTNAVQMVTQEHKQRVSQITTPQPPPSPPPKEQPIISCLVCLDSAGTIKETSRTLCSTVCGHVFCSACMEEVVKRKKQCPVCRKKLTKKQYHPLFI